MKRSKKLQFWLVFFKKKKEEEEASFNSLSLTSKAKHSDYFGAIEIDTLNSAVAEF